MSVYRERDRLRLFTAPSYAAKCPHCGHVVCKYAFTDIEAKDELRRHVETSHAAAAPPSGGPSDTPREDA